MDRWKKRLAKNDVYFSADPTPECRENSCSKCVRRFSQLLRKPVSGATQAPEYATKLSLVQLFIHSVFRRHYIASSIPLGELNFESFKDSLHGEIL